MFSRKSPGYGVYFQEDAWLWGYVFKILPWFILWVHTRNSHRPMYTRPHIGVTPLPRIEISLIGEQMYCCARQEYKFRHYADDVLLEEN